MKHCLLVLALLLFSVGPCFGAELRLEIETAQTELKKTLQEAIILPEGVNSAGVLNHPWLKHYRKQLPLLVNNTLEPYGYFHSQTTSTLEQNGDKYLLTVNVCAGEAITISSLVLQVSGPGAEVPELQQAVKSFPLHQGAILRQDIYEQGKAALLQDATELGFLDADFIAHQLLVYRAQHRAEIILHLETGKRYHFGTTTFSGNSNYPDRFLARYLSYHQGDIYSPQQLGQTQINLVNADLFKSVRIAADKAAATGIELPVNIELQSSPRHRLRPGIGYGTDTGARISLRYRDLNLFQLGHELKGDLLLAEKKQSLVATYIIPDINRLDSQTQLRVGFDQEDSDSCFSQKLFTEGEYQRAFGGNLMATIFLLLSDEYAEIAAEKDRSRMLLPGARLQWRYIDDPITPSYGWQGNIEIKGAHSAVLSDTSLVQLTALSTTLLPLAPNFSVLVRLHGGTTWHDDPLTEMPASLRFFAGGDRSVRGYAYQSLGPKDAKGDVVGGKHLLVANVELERKFTAEWGTAIFYDVGNAFDSFANYELEQGTGIGVRRYTQIGPIRLDLAQQIGTSKPRWRIHLSMGFGW